MCSACSLDVCVGTDILPITMARLVPGRNLSFHSLSCSRFDHAVVAPEVLKDCVEKFWGSLEKNDY